MTTAAADPGRTPPTATATAAVPVKPFRQRAARPRAVRVDAYKLLKIDDSRVRRLGISIGIGMAVIIAGTVLVGKSFTFLTLLPIVLGVIAVAARDQWTALLLYTAYAAMEGMYKYLSNFSTAVYMVAPLLLGVIVVAWGIARQAPGKTGGATASGGLSSPAVAATAGLFCMVAFLQSFHPGGSGVVSGFATAFLWYIGPVLMLFVTGTVVRSTYQIITLCYALLMIGTVVSAFALVQYQMGEAWTMSKLPGYENTNAGDWGGGTFRPASTTSSGGGGCFWAHFAIGAGLVLLTAPNIKSGSKFAVGIAIGVNGVALLLSAVRALVFIDLFTIPLFLVLQARSPREIVRSLGGMVAASALIFVSLNIASALTGGRIMKRYTGTYANPIQRFSTERGSNLQILPLMIQEFPLGIGYQRGIGAHGTSEKGEGFVDLAGNRETQLSCWQADIGLPGLVLGTILVLQAVLLGWKVQRGVRVPHLRPFGVMIFSLVTTYSLGIFLGPALQGAVAYWILVGVLLALPQVEKAERAVMAAAMAEQEAAKNKPRSAAGRDENRFARWQQRPLLPGGAAAPRDPR